jgi:lipopolysaccharide transport system ATP-binding protein
MSSVVIRIDGLGKRYTLGQRGSYLTLRDTLATSLGAPVRRLSSRSSRPPDRQQKEHIWALRDVSFDVDQGEIVGIIGRNGAGKSTLLKILSRITYPTEGRVTLRGRVGSLLEVGTGFHPELSGRENIFLNGTILGLKRAEILRKFDDIVEFSEIQAFLDTPVKRYSSGMYVRLAFAVAAHLETDILFVDEVLAVGDAAFQEKCLGKMGDVARSGRTILLVSHNMNSIRRLCSRSLLFEGGRLADAGPTKDIVDRYLSGGTDSPPPNTWVDVSKLPREGNRSVYVSALRYSGCDDNARSLPFPFGRLNVDLRLISSSPRRLNSVAVTIYDSNGTKLVNADTLSLGQLVDLKQGSNQVSFTIDELHLNPGRYRLGFWVAHHPADVFDFVDNAISMEVVDVDINQPGIRPKNDGIVANRFRVAAGDEF